MYERTKSQSVPERGRHVGDGHISVALTMHFTPLLQSLDGSHAPSRDRDAGTVQTESATGGGLSAEEPEEREINTKSLLRI